MRDRYNLNNLPQGQGDQEMMDYGSRKYQIFFTYKALLFKALASYKQIAPFLHV
jgi:hypothetical protein